MQFHQVYDCDDFTRYCHSLEPDRFDDLRQEVAIAIYTLPESQRKQIEKDGYMLRYAQRTAFYTHVKWYRDCKRNPVVTTPHPNPMNLGTDMNVREKALALIQSDLKCRQYSIPAKMLLYSAKHGSVREFSRISKIPYKTLHTIVSSYKKRIRKWIRESE